jgi:hypothetical protein
VDALRRHAAAGRLGADELEARLECALAAQTRQELAVLQGDLPALAQSAPRRRPGADTRVEWLSYVGVAVVLIAVWASTGAGAFWPAWPLGFWGAALAFKSGRLPWSAPRRW